MLIVCEKENQERTGTEQQPHKDYVVQKKGATLRSLGHAIEES